MTSNIQQLEQAAKHFGETATAVSDVINGGTHDAESDIVYAINEALVALSKVVACHKALEQDAGGLHQRNLTLLRRNIETVADFTKDIAEKMQQAEDAEDSDMGPAQHAV